MRRYIVLVLIVLEILVAGSLPHFCLERSYLPPHFTVHHLLCFGMPVLSFALDVILLTVFLTSVFAKHSYGVFRKVLTGVLIYAAMIVVKILVALLVVFVCFCLAIRLPL